MLVADRAANRFAGLTSRWMMPASCASSSERNAWSAKGTARSRRRPAALAHERTRSAPARYSIAKYRSRRRSRRSRRRARCSATSAGSVACASRSKRATRAGRPLPAQDLERDVPLQRLVPREPDLVHAAFADARLETVAAEASRLAQLNARVVPICPLNVEMIAGGEQDRIVRAEKRDLRRDADTARDVGPKLRRKRTTAESSSTARRREPERVAPRCGTASASIKITSARPSITGSPRRPSRAP